MPIDKEKAAAFLESDEFKKLAPDEQKAVVARLRQEFQGAGATAQAQGQPGFFSRFSEATGVPTSQEGLEAMKPSLTDVLVPAVPLARTIYGYGKKLVEEGGKFGREATEASRNIAQGGPVLANVGKGAAAATEFGLKGVLGPVGGAGVHHFGEDVASGHIMSAAGDAVGTVFNALLLKGSTKLAPEAAGNKLALAADLKSGVENMRKVLPDIERHLPKANPTVKDTLTAINKAKDDMNLQSGLAMQPIRATEMVPTAIADRIKARVTPDMVMTAEGRAKIGLFKRVATDYEKPWTFEQLDARRMNLREEVKGYESMAPADKASFLRANPDIAAKVEEFHGIKDIVYPAMDKAAGKPEGYFSALKSRQHTLIDLQKIFDKRLDDLTTKTAKIKASSRFSEENMSVYASGAHPGYSIHKVQRIIKKQNPLADANAQTSRAFSGRTIPKAFLYSMPVRTILLEDSAEQKTPGQMKKELREIQERHTPATSSNPLSPTAEQ